MLKMNIYCSNTRRESITFNISVVKEEKEDAIDGGVMVMMVIMVMVLKVGLGDDECLHF